MTDPRIDAYIKKAKPFAQPILTHIRKLVHTACPEIEETMKWSFPHFDYKGEMMCSMASFKEHAVFGFWKAKLMKDPVLLENAQSETAMGHMGRLTSVNDLPSDKKMISYIKEAMKLNDEGKKVPKPKVTKEREELVAPPDLKKALAKNKAAKTTFEAFPYSKKKEYIEWLTEAKTDETREKRLLQAIEWMAEGKSRHWKYVKK